MSNVVRVIIFVLCVVALYYLVITLSRSVSEGDGETGSLRPAQETWVAAHSLDPISLAGRSGNASS